MSTSKTFLPYGWRWPDGSVAERRFIHRETAVRFFGNIRGNVVRFRRKLEPTPAEIQDTHDLIARALDGPGWDYEARIALRGAMTALHWAIGGCNCAGRRNFDATIARLRAMRDQLNQKAK